MYLERGPQFVLIFDLGSYTSVLPNILFLLMVDQYSAILWGNYFQEFALLFFLEVVLNKKEGSECYLHQKVRNVSGISIIIILFNFSYAMKHSLWKLLLFTYVCPWNNPLLYHFWKLRIVIIKKYVSDINECDMLSSLLCLIS